MIKAPYNFVPLENKAFYPSWANHISQDIPFEDGVSGSIEYTIEAKTPIFVRNGYTDREHPDDLHLHYPHLPSAHSEHRNSTRGYNTAAVLSPR